MAVLEETLHDLSRWGRAALALIPALLVLYLGTVIGATLVSANRDARAIAGLLGYHVIVVGIPVLIALRAVRGGRRWSGAVTRAAITSLLGQLVFAPVGIAALSMA